MRRSNEPFWWALFSVGGTLTALLLPAHVLLLWIAPPLGWLGSPDYVSLLGLVHRPAVRLYLFLLISLSLLHWGHRFRYTLYDGLQLKHLHVPVAFLCYAVAVTGSAVTAYVLWNF